MANQAPINGAAPPDELYVGYLPVPQHQRRFLRWLVPAALWSLCALTFVWARSQADPGPAVWEDGRPERFVGTVATAPYPILFANTDGKPGARAMLLVEAGKHGGGDRVSSLSGRRVSVSGWRLHRDGREIVELEPGESGIRADQADPAAAPLPAPTEQGQVVLRGEIVDSKCFLGAMKPGEGKTHKECATLCITGGIPPMLVTRDAGGRVSYFLLMGPGGGALDRSVFPLIGEPVEVSGELADWNGLWLLRVRPENVRPL
jgi:hypothetical protein